MLAIDKESHRVSDGIEDQAHMNEPGGQTRNGN